MSFDAKKWPIKRLSECCASISDGDHQPPPKADEGVPFVTISNIVSNKLDFSDTMHVPMSYYENLDSKRRAQPGDILYSVVGSFGIPVFIEDNAPFVFQRHIAILRPSSEVVLPKYLYYTMLSPIFYKKADIAAIGAAQRTISLTALRNMEIVVPSLDVQQKVIDLLAPYDNLIATNQKQIALLEEAAQRIYKEWFIDFRFPGYEGTTFDNGIPIEWHYGELGEVAQFRRGKTITKDDAIAGDVPVIAGGLTPAYYHNQSNTSAPVVTVSGSGANAGFTRMYHIRVWASDCSFIDSFSTKFIYFVYCYLKANKQSIDNLQKGSAQPHVYAKDLNQLRALIPSLDIVESFHELVKPLFDRIATLEKQVLLLTEARERILPQLI